MLFSSIWIVRAQQEILFNNPWRLLDMRIDGEFINVPSNDEVSIVPLELLEQPEDNFSSEVCNWIGGTMSFDVSSLIILEEPVVTLIECESSENELFESQYFNFFFENIGVELEYEFTWVDPVIESNGGAIHLQIVAPNGDYVYYTNNLLTTQDLIKPDFHLFPNPFHDRITILQERNIEIISVLLYDVNGRLLHDTLELENQQILLPSLEKGIYFFQIITVDGRIKTIPMIKK